jgi:putative phosphoesterase
MKILVISDIHENFDNLSRVLEQISNLWVEMIFCLWDLINGWIARMIASQDIPTHLVWWNNDWTRVAITKKFMEANNKSVVSDECFDICKVGWQSIFLTHYPLLAQLAAKSWDYNAVFYWHNHILSMEKIWSCVLFNPGEISAHKTQTCTFWIYDTVSNTVEIHNIQNPSSIKTEISKDFMRNLKLKKSDRKFW